MGMTKKDDGMTKREEKNAPSKGARERTTVLLQSSVSLGCGVHPEG
jgi:hypothetical protein